MQHVQQLQTHVQFVKILIIQMELYVVYVQVKIVQNVINHLEFVVNV